MVSRVFSADRVITGDGHTVIGAGFLTVDGTGRIVAVDAGAPAASPGRPPGRHFAGCTILPGLVDLHVHLGYWYKKPDAALYDDGLIALFTAAALREAISLGVTGVRDMASKDGLPLTMRRAIDRGFVPAAPRFFFANQLICITGGHSWQLAGAIRQANGPWDLRAAAREQVRAGAQWVKLAASGAFDVEFTREELEAAVDEAHRLGAKVAVHSSTPAAIRMCVEVGVDTIEHGTELDVESARMMADKGIAWVPTMVAYFSLAEQCRQAEADPAGAPAFLDETLRYRCPYFLHAERCYRERFSRILETGVTIATGTDIVLEGYPVTPVAREMAIMVELGMSPLQAIRAATASGAAALGQASEFGVLEPGRLADFVVVEGNPAEDISAVNRVKAVYLGGRLVHEAGG